MFSTASHQRGWKETLSSPQLCGCGCLERDPPEASAVKQSKGRKSARTHRIIQDTNRSASITSVGLLVAHSQCQARPSTALHSPSPPNHLLFPPSRQPVAFLAYQRRLIGYRHLGSVAFGWSTWESLASLLSPRKVLVER